VPSKSCYPYLMDVVSLDYGKLRFKCALNMIVSLLMESNDRSIYEGNLNMECTYTGKAKSVTFNFRKLHTNSQTQPFAASDIQTDHSTILDCTPCMQLKKNKNDEMGKTIYFVVDNDKGQKGKSLWCVRGAFSCSLSLPITTLIIFQKLSKRRYKLKHLKCIKSNPFSW